MDDTTIAASLSPSSIHFHSKPGLICLILAAFLFSLSTSISHQPHPHSDLLLIFCDQGSISAGYLICAITIYLSKPSPKSCVLIQSLLAVMSPWIPLYVLNWKGVFIEKLVLGLAGPFPITIRFFTHFVPSYRKSRYWLCILAAHVTGSILGFPVASLTHPLHTWLSAPWLLLLLCTCLVFPRTREEECLGVSPIEHSVWNPCTVHWLILICNAAKQVILTTFPSIFRLILSWHNDEMTLSWVAYQSLNLCLLLCFLSTHSYHFLLPKVTLGVVLGSLLGYWRYSTTASLASVAFLSLAGLLGDFAAFAYFGRCYARTEGRWQIAAQFGALFGDILVCFFPNPPTSQWTNVNFPLFLLSLTVVVTCLFRRLFLSTHNQLQ